jgi:hypothetical protein
MSFAPKVDGYEDTTDKRAQLFAEGKFKPTGDPDKAAKAMIQLAQHPNPPVHLVLGSDAITMLKQADAERTAEMEEWMQVSTSTDSDNADDFSKTEQGQFMMKSK